ncbi:MAG: histidine--tRNA ligase [Actinomycetota bacterium]|nr:histidine--tRNA ligase [Actinomycetota bacterium]
METKYSAPKGMKDYLYPESFEMERIYSTASEVLEIHGYKKIETPVLEKAELFYRGVGEDTDIVKKEMYSFKDKDGELLCLRPEGTAPVIRAYLENRLDGLGLPLKLYYSGPMFRRERPQAGRSREFHQVGAEAIGSDDPLLDAEVISLSCLIFEKLGLRDFKLLINSVGCSNCRHSYTGKLKKFIDGIEGDLCVDCRARKKTNPLRVLDCKRGSCMEALKDAPVIRNFLCDDCERHINKVIEALRDMEITFEENERLVRGIDYYTRTAFEFVFEGLGAKNTVSAGGRYDDLAETLGGPRTPAVGFSLGLERLMLAQRKAHASSVSSRTLDVFVATVGPDAREFAFSLLRMLRRSGISADIDYLSRSLKSQMKHADRLGAKLVVIAGGEEQEKGEVVLRELETSTQETVSVDSLPHSVKSLLSGSVCDV